MYTAKSKQTQTNLSPVKPLTKEEHCLVELFMNPYQPVSFPSESDQSRPSSKASERCHKKSNSMREALP